MPADVARAAFRLAKLERSATAAIPAGGWSMIFPAGQSERAFPAISATREGARDPMMRETMGMEAAKAFFGSEAPGVEIHLQPHPAAPLAPGAVEGNHVYLNPAAKRLGRERWRHILGHELAHVAQQRQGRVQPTGWLAGCAVNQEASLEAEAEELGRRFAAGASSLAQAGVRALPHRPVLQCMLSIGGQPVQTGLDLSPKAQSILEFIPGGEAWLRAIGRARPQYNFDNEYEFLGGIQSGLHGSPLLLLRRLGLSIHPLALQEMEKPEIDTLLSVERSEQENSVSRMRVKKALAAHKLWAEPEFVIGDEFLRHAGVESEPLFGSLSLADRVALFDLVNNASSENALSLMLQKEAAAFAVGRAQSAQEFVDYYQFFMAQVQEKPPQSHTSARRARFAEAAAEAVGDLLYDLLWCPRLERAPAPGEMPRILAQWSARGFCLGFPRLSAALAHMAQFADLQGATGAAAGQLIGRYMDGLQSQWLQRTPAAMRYSQDGRDRQYIYELPAATAELRLAEDGSLTIGPFQPRAGRSAEKR